MVVWPLKTTERCQAGDIGAKNCPSSLLTLSVCPGSHSDVFDRPPDIVDEVAISEKAGRTSMMHRRSSQARLDESFIAHLYQRHAPGLFTYVRRQTVAREDAEDVLLEVFLAAFKQEQISTWPEEQQLAWLRQITRHKLADHYRQESKRSAVALEAVADTLYADEAQAPEQVALQREAERQLHTAISHLPASQQEVLRLHFGEGLRCVEIAQFLGKGEGAVRMALSRALNLLRTRYTER
jgi:RNA polymerase sigma factor (sigma-70 family)